MGCAVCGTAIAPGQGFFSGRGEVCATCNLADEHASQDAAQLAQNSQVGGLPKLPNGKFSHSTSTVTTDPDGTVRTTTQTTSVNLGFVGSLLKLLGIK